MIKSIIIIIVLLIHAGAIQAQGYKKQVLNKAELKQGVLVRYEEKNKFVYAELILYKSGKYLYSNGVCMGDYHSEGTWKRKGDKYILNSRMQQNGLPIELIYLNDTTGSSGSFPLKIVKDYKGEQLIQAMVFINNDSNSCAPDMENCTGSYEKIDSVRLAFNGLSSKWVKVENKPYKYLQIILKTDGRPLDNYYVFENVEVQVRGATIKFLD
jgi:hypothetical protein